MLNCILRQKQPPEQWKKVNIQTTYKGKGSTKMLNNYRAIFLTNILSKIFEKIVYSRIHNNINNYTSPFQAGSQKNQRTNYNMFLLRGAIDHSLYTNSPLTIIFYNFQQCFDSIWLQDSMLYLWNAGMQDEVFYLNSILIN